ncbi:MAG: VPDSG-CTERM sorting domain-containing protein [Limisphaerales bacterium]
MKIKLAGIAGIVAAMLAITSVQAIPISGSIYMGGIATLNSGDNTVTSWPLVFVTADSGAFGSVNPFSLVTMSSSPWVFSPAPGQALSDLWSVGGFTFDFTSDTVTTSGNLLIIDGSGTISSSNPGYSTTDFTWNLAANVLNRGDFIFGASTGGSAGGGPGNQVPDGGLTVALLGIALTGVEVFRRKLNKA